MTKISVAILTFNEEKNIAACLDSVSQLADEIVLVDEKSSDKTVTIAKKYTSKIFFVDHEVNFHKHKQIAFDKCTGDWIFQIDADERVTPDLAAEIKKVVANGAFSGYEIPRKNIIFGKWIAHTGWYPDYQVRLFQHGKGQLTTQSNHEQIKVDEPVGKLSADLLHEHYHSIEQFIDRLNRYSGNDAEVLCAAGEKVIWSDALKYPADEFFKRFFLWEGYLDGIHGLVLSLFQAFNRLVVFAKLWEKQKFVETEVNLRAGVITESKKISKDWYHWLAQTENNPLFKLSYKLKKQL